LTAFNTDRAPSPKVTHDNAVEIWLRLWRGDFKHRIAQHFEINVARIYDVRRGKLHPGSEAAAREIWNKQNAA